jgi:hypothetical protein
MKYLLERMGTSFPDRSSVLADLALCLTLFSSPTMNSSSTLKQKTLAGDSNGEQASAQGMYSAASTNLAVWNSFAGRAEALSAQPIEATAASKIAIIRARLSD